MLAVSGVMGTTPMLAPSLNVRSSHMKRKSWIALSSFSAASIASSTVQFSSSTPNSSPPSRASVSRQRIFDLSNAPS